MNRAKPTAVRRPSAAAKPSGARGQRGGFAGLPARPALLRESGLDQLPSVLGGPRGGGTARLPPGRGISAQAGPTGSGR